MAKKTAPLLPPTEELLCQFGARLRVARLRRRLSAKQVAQRAGMSPMTLRSLERGGSGVTMGAYLAVMQVLGIERDLNLLATADPVGRDLQDARLPAHGAKSRPRPRSIQPSAGTRTVPTGAVTTDLRGLVDGSSLSQLRKVADTSPKEQLRKVAAAMPGAQLREARAALPSQQLREAVARVDGPARELAKLRTSPERANPSLQNGGFSSAEELSRLIESPALPKRKR
ncbi:MAG: helix-turn-helix domain-containing protein [Ramlibacter sp.]|nr:helix-turn-helix domain-containing protein [Ramlibacter sp.]